MKIVPYSTNSLIQFFTISVLCTLITLVTTTPSEDDWIRRCSDFYGDVEYTAKCSNGKIICSCVCPGKKTPRQYDPTCCPEFPPLPSDLTVLQLPSEIDNLTTPTPPTGSCILYRMFNCHNNTTRHCIDDDAILKLNETETFKFLYGIRSISIPSNCRVTRHVKDSMCPNTPSIEEITTSGNVENALTINEESYECHCSKDSPTTTTTTETPTEAPTNITTTVSPSPYPEEGDNRTFGLIAGLFLMIIIYASTISIIFLGGYLEDLDNAEKEKSLSSESSNDFTFEEVIPQNHDHYSVTQPPNNDNTIPPVSMVTAVRKKSIEKVWLSSQNLSLTFPYQALGKGSYGQVWKAECTKTGNFFAVKKINLYDALRNSDQSEDKASKLRREIENLTRIRNDNVVQLLRWWIENHSGKTTNDLTFLEQADASTSSGRPYFLFLQMEYCHLTLKRWLVDNPSQNREFAIIRRMFLQIASGLRALHDLQIVHRDIKPDNIMCNFNGK